MNANKKPGKRRLFVLLWGLIFLSSILIGGSSFSEPINTNYDSKGSEPIDSLMTVQEISCGPPKSTTTPPKTTPPVTTTSTTTNPVDTSTTTPTTTVSETGLLLLSILGLGIALLFVLRRPRGV